MLKTLKAEDIIPSPTNPRQDITPHDDEYRQIKKSIERFGLAEPFVVNAANNHCLSGNNRLTVLKDMGVEDIPCVIVNEPDANREIALTIALNKIKGKWDWEKLIGLFNAVQYEDIEVTGFWGDELDELLNGIGDYIAPDDDDSDDPVLDTTINAKVGGYSFSIGRDDYIELINEIRVAKGFDDKAIIAELKLRLKGK
jgi:hypothetical protein